MKSIGDSNLRDCGSRLNTSHVQNISWVYPGANFSSMAPCIQDKDSKETDFIAVNLGTNDALNTAIDGHALLGIKKVVDSLKRSVNTPLLICAVPPTLDLYANKTRSMINDYLQFECSRNSHQMRFVDADISLKDIGQDGIHLKPEGKDKLCRSILTAALDFTRDCKHAMMPPHRFSIMPLK